MSKLKLIQLRQENCGYNPEDANFEEIHSLDANDNTILCTDSDNHTSEWVKTNAKNELDFIERFFGIYGIIYKNNFYIRE